MASIFTDLPVLLLAGAFFLGALVQRISGIGLGLVAAPIVVVLIDPGAGILLLNFAGAASSGVLFVLLRRDVGWTWYLRTLPGIVLGVTCGVALSILARPQALQIGIGLLIATLVIAGSLARGVSLRRSLLFDICVGALTGVASSVASAGGAVVVAYKDMARISHREFLGTMQLFGLTAAGSSAVWKVLAGSASQWTLPGAGIAIVAGTGIAAGLGIGNAVASRVPTRVASISAKAVALGGAALAVGKGLGLV